MYQYNKNNISLARTLRKQMTPWERKLWYDFLRQYPIRFKRQKAIGQYIVDFYCAKAKVVIELDGSQHYEESGVLNDGKRTEFLEGYGIDVVRIPNNEVSRNFQGVCHYIDNIIKQRLGSP